MMPASMALPRRWLLPFVAVAACRGVTTSYAYPDDLTHPNYVKRTLATREFARRRDADRLPEAFGLLMDEEAHIRSLAHETIRSLMPGGEDFGYEPYFSEEVRAGIVARWKAWWRKSALEEGRDG